MIFETKFDLGQTVYWLEEGKLRRHRGKIEWICLYPDSTTYAVRMDDGDDNRNGKLDIKNGVELYGSLEEIVNAVKQCLDGLREQMDDL